MKNVHFLLHLFGEQRMVLENPETKPDIIKKLETQYFGDNTENLGEKEKRLTAIHEFLSSDEKKEQEKIKEAKLESTLSLKSPDGTVGSFGETILDFGTNQLARQMGLSGRQQILRQTDLKKSFDEGLTVAEVEKQRAEQNSTSITFRKETKENGENYIAILGIDEKGEEKGLAIFNMQSEFTKKTLEKKDAILEEIGEERKKIQEQITEELTAMTRIQEEAKKWTENLKTNLLLEGHYEAYVEEEIQRATWGNREEYVSIVIQRPAQKNPPKPAEKVLRIDASFENGEYKYLVRNLISEQELTSGEASKGEPEGPIFPDERAIQKMLEEPERGAAYEDETPRIVEEKPEQEEPKEEEKPTVVAEKIEGSKKIGKKEPEVKTNPETGLRELVVTTKRGTKLTYRETGKRTQGGEKTPAGNPIWQYENTGEYYADSGLRVNSDGTDYTGEGQKESKIIGQHVKLTRDLEKDLSEQTGRKIKLEEKTENPDKFKIETGIKAAEQAIKNIIELVKQKDEKYSTIDGIASELEKLGKPENSPWNLMPELKATTLDVYGVQISWTKEKGFESGNKEILQTKVVQILRNAPEKDMYETFLAQEETLKHDKSLQEKVEKAQEEWKKQYREKMNKTYKLGFEDFGALNFAEGRMSEEEIAKKWKLFNGTERINQIMTNYFGLSIHEVPKKVAAIVSEGNNYEVEFEDVMKFLPPNQSALDDIDTGQLMDRMGKKDSALNFSEDIEEEDIVEMLSKPDKLGEILDKLMASKLEADKFLTDKIFKHIVAPSIDLLESLQDLRPSEAKKEKKEKYSEFPAEQLKIVKQIEKLCTVKDKRSGWQKFKNGFAGKENWAYMAQLDGTTKFTDRSKLTGEMTEEAAKNFMLYDGEYYSIDFVNGLKTLDVAKLQEAVNKFIELGLLQKYTGKGGEPPTEKEIEEILNSEKFQKEKTELRINDLANDKITQKQIDAFQMGLLIEYNAKYEEQMNLPENKALQDVYKWLIKVGTPPKEIPGIMDNILAAGGIQFDTEGKIVGGGGAINIRLSKNVSMVLEATSTQVGANVVCKFKGPGNSTFEFTVGVNTSGINTGLANTHKLGGSVLGTAYGGFQWNIFEGQLIPQGGAGYIVSIDADEAAKRKTEKIVNEAGFKEMATTIDEGSDEKILETAKRNSRYSYLASGRYKIGGKIPLSESEILALVKQDYRNLKEEGVEESNGYLTNTRFLPITKFGIGFPTIITFAIGFEMQLSRPMLKEEAKLLGLMSDCGVETKAELELTKIDASKDYVENLEGVFITKDGRIGHLEKDGKKEVDFTGFVDEKERNSKLANANMQIEEHGGDRVLRIYDIDGIEAEVHVDPALDGELVARTDGGEIVLEGNIDNLVVSRERFIIPAKTGKYGSTIRDVITVRKKSSVLGGRTRSWVIEHESAYLEKLPDYQWAKKDGTARRFEGESKTIFDVQGWQSANPSLRDSLRGERNKEKEIEDYEMEEKMELVRTQRKIPEASQKKLDEAVKNDEIQSMIKTGIDKAMKENKEFLKELRKNADNTGELVKLIYKYEKEIFGRELEDEEKNVAVQYLLRASYIDFANIAAKKLGKTPEEFAELAKSREEFDKLTPEQRKVIVNYINTERKILTENARFVAKALKDEFNKAIERLKKRGVSIAKTGQDVADQIVKDISEKVKEVNSDTPPDELFNHPLFTTEVDPLTVGSTICYGTHKTNEKGANVPAMAKTIESQETAQRTVRTAGFIKNTSTEYEDGSEMKTILLETANPMYESYKDILDSELGVKIASLGALVLMMKNEDYKRTMEAFRDPSLAEKPEYQASLGEFKKICETMRANELAGKPTVTKWKDLTINIYLSAGKTRSAAWADCTNASFEVSEGGRVEIVKGDKLVAVVQETYETVEASTSKEYLELGFGIGLAKPAKKKTPPKEEPPKDGKHHKDGIAENQPTAEGAKISEKPVKVEAAGGSHTVETGPSSTGGSPSRH